MAKKKKTRKQPAPPLPGMTCKRCGQEVSTGLVFLCGPKAWIPFCSRCLYQSDNRMAVAIAATGMSEGDLADQMEVSRHTIGAWRRGRTKRPKQHNLERLASLAGVSVDWLTGQEDNPQR